MKFSTHDVRLLITLLGYSVHSMKLLVQTWMGLENLPKFLSEENLDELKQGCDKIVARDGETLILTFSEHERKRIHRLAAWGRPYVADCGDWDDSLYRYDDRWDEAHADECPPEIEATNAICEAFDELGEILDEATGEPDNVFDKLARRTRAGMLGQGFRNISYSIAHGPTHANCECAVVVDDPLRHTHTGFPSAADLNGRIIAMDIAQNITKTIQESVKQKWDNVIREQRHSNWHDVPRLSRELQDAAPQEAVGDHLDAARYYGVSVSRLTKDDEA